MTTQLILSDNTTDFVTYLNPAIEFDGGECEAALAHLETYNSIPNITAKNNIFKYSIDKGTSWKVIELPVDAYEFTQIVDEIQRQLAANDDFDKEQNSHYINIDIYRLSSLIIIANDNYMVNFDCENSIGPTLGFTNETIGPGFHKSPNIVNIMDINSILINVDFISGTYVNNRRLPTIHSFYPKVGPGYKIIHEPKHLFYLPVTSKKLDGVRLWLTDQDGNGINLQGEILTVTIYIKKCQKN